MAKDCDDVVAASVDCHEFDLLGEALGRLAVYLPPICLEQLDHHWLAI